MMKKSYTIGKNLDLTYQVRKVEDYSGDKSISGFGKENRKEHYVLAKFHSIGYYLVAPLMMGVFVGFGLDAYFDSKPTFVLIFVIIGFISSIYNLYRLAKEG